MWRIVRECPLNPKGQAKEKLRLAHLAHLAYNAMNDGDHPRVLLTKKTTNALRADALFVDSGASRHLTSDRSSFVSYTTLEKPIPIQLGDNSEIHAIRAGTSRTHVKTPTGIQTMDFTCTLYAPKLAGSLLSVGQLTAVPGVKLELEGPLCLIKLRGTTLCQASFKDGLYTLDLASPSMTCTESASPSMLEAKTPAPAGKRFTGGSAI